MKRQLFNIQWIALAFLGGMALSCQSNEIIETGQVALVFEMKGFDGFQNGFDTRAVGAVESGALTIALGQKNAEFTVAASTNGTAQLALKEGEDNPYFAVPVGAEATSGLAVWGTITAETGSNGATQTIYAKNTGEAVVTGATSADQTATATIPIVPATIRLRFTLKGAFGEQMSDLAAIPFGATVATPLLPPDPDDPWDLTGDTPALKGLETEATANNQVYIEVLPDTIKAGAIFLSELKPIEESLEDYTFTSEQQTIVDRYADRTFVIRAPSSGALVFEAGKQYDFTLRLSGGIEATVEQVIVTEFEPLPEKEIVITRATTNEII